MCYLVCIRSQAFHRYSGTTKKQKSMKSSLANRMFEIALSAYMIAIKSHILQPIQIPKCFIDWVKGREASNPDYTFVVSSGTQYNEPTLFGWRIRKNLVTYHQDGLLYEVRILTGKPLQKKDVSAAIGFDYDSLQPVAPGIFILPLRDQPRGLVFFEAKSWDTLAELEKSFEASKKKID